MTLALAVPGIVLAAIASKGVHCTKVALLAGLAVRL